MLEPHAHGRGLAEGDATRARMMKAEERALAIAIGMDRNSLACLSSFLVCVCSLLSLDSILHPTCPIRVCRLGALCGVLACRMKEVDRDIDCHYIAKFASSSRDVVSWGNFSSLNLAVPVLAYDSLTACT